MNVMWLASWYPNRTDPSLGDFIERHARAVAPFLKKLTIIAVVKDVSMPVNATETVVQQQGNIETHIVYYGPGKWGGIAGRLLSLQRSTALYGQVFEQLVANSGLPDLLHVHVAMKAGLFATKIKKQHKIPYVLTEHWSGYKRESSPNIYDRGWLFTWLTKKVLRQASVLLPVSKDLGDTITHNFWRLPVHVVPNVVDTRYFYLNPSLPPVFTFIHPSYMNYPKNPEGILEACHRLKQQGYQFELKIIGSRNPEAKALAGKLQLLDTEVFFEDAIPYKDVAIRMQHSHALLMFSRYENLPCIILEALCCGLPVVSSRVGGIAEVVNDTNGILADNNNVEQLVQAMKQLMENYALYNRKKIADDASSLFSYEAVGKQLFNQYIQNLNEFS